MIRFNALRDLRRCTIPHFAPPCKMPPTPCARAQEANQRLLGAATMVRSNAQANRSDAVAALLNPTTGIREEQKRKGLKPHDHTRDNKQYIKQLQQLNRTREEVAAVEASTPRKASSKYKDVPARVMTPRQLDRPSTAPAARPSSARPPLEPYATEGSNARRADPRKE